MSPRRCIAVIFLVCGVIGGSAAVVPAYAQTTTSQGVAVISADAAQLAGYTGKRVQVAVIDMGFDIYNPEIAANIAGYRSFDYHHDIRGTYSDHGTSVAEIILDVAPNAELYLYNVNSDIELVNAIDHIIGRGDIDIVTTSIYWFNSVGPTDGTSIVSQKVDEARDSGILWVSSVGNHANKHWQGTFSDPDGNRWHNFQGIGEVIDIDVKAGDRLRVALSWWDSPGQDYELCLYGNIIYNSLYKIDCSTRSQWYHSSPYEYLSYDVPYDRTLYISILEYSASRAVDFQLFSSHDLNRYGVHDSSILIPADARGSMSVAAADWRNPDSLKDYSSRGPTTDGRTKPDITGPTCVTTNSYAGYFCGTSASAPHAAGVAALAMEKYPYAEAHQIREMLESNTANYHPKSNSDGTGMVSAVFLTTAGLEEKVADLEEKVRDLEQKLEELAADLLDILSRLAALESAPSTL